MWRNRHEAPFKEGQAYNVATRVGGEFCEKKGVKFTLQTVFENTWTHFDRGEAFVSFVIRFVLSFKIQDAIYKAG